MVPFHKPHFFRYDGTRTFPKNPPSLPVNHIWRLNWTHFGVVMEKCQSIQTREKKRILINFNLVLLNKISEDTNI